MTRLLRLLAFAIAIAGAVDPAITLSGASRARIALVALDPASAISVSIRDRIARDLSTSYDVVPAITSDAAAAVVIGESYPDAPLVRSRFGAALPDALLVATVTTKGPSPNGAHIVRVDTPREVPAATAIHVDAEIASRGTVGQTTDAIVTIAGLEVGRASHQWTTDGERWRASIDAVPVGDPPYVLRIEAGTKADIVVGLRRDPIRVEFYDPRPSWATTFVRRALEADPRFQVATVSSTSRGISTRAGEAVALNDPRLDTFDTVVVGGLDRLSAADVGALDRYMRERGGAVVVLPDQRIESGPARDLVPGLAERLLEQPAKLVVAPAMAAPQASELLVFHTLPPAADVIARLPGDSAPAIVSMPRGDGRLLVSGAMDAWRYRAADNGAFDRFWQSTIAGLALAVPPPIAIDVDPPLLRPGQPGIVIARVRSREARGVSASIDGQPLRLVPAAESGVYRGEFVAGPASGPSTIDVRADAVAGTHGARSLIVRPDAQVLSPASAPSLTLLAKSHRGIDVTPDRVSDLERFLRAAIDAPRVPLVRHPMRSTWWILPFAFCLSAEWWLRRRGGLR
jgi:hypothetical protein